MKYWRSGNVLFLILLAVALFAALSYAVTQSSRSGGKDISDEDARLAASQIIQYATLVEQTITRLRLSNGCRDTQISFAADSDGDGNWYDTDDDYHNPNAPTDFRCHVFHLDGGGTPPLTPSADWLDEAHISEARFGEYYFVGDSEVLMIGTDVLGGFDGDNSDEELAITLNYINEPICKSINKILHNDSIIYNEVSNSIRLNQPFIGVFTSGPQIDVGLSAAVHNACFESELDIPKRNSFYHVLIPR